MRSAALQEAADRGRELYPLASLDLVSRGLSLGRVLISPSVRVTALGQVTHVSSPGEWEQIEYGSGIESNTLDAVQTSITVPDPTGSLLRLLETYDPRGSAVTQYVASDGLILADYETIFTGILEDWEKRDQRVSLRMKTDDSLLRKPIPERTFARTEWGSAADTTIYETAVPLCFGVWNAFAVTGRGMVPAVNVRYDETLGYWWWASLGHQVEITRVFANGEVQDSAGWTTKRGVYGGALCTLIVFTEGYQPEKGDTVSFDCKGPDASGLYAGPSITNPVRILRTALEEYCFRATPTGAYRGDYAGIDDTSWDAAEAWYEARGYVCARRFGGDQNPETGVEAVQSFLDSNEWARIHYNEFGKLAFVIIDPDDFEPVAARWFRIDKHHDGGRVDYQPGDRKEVYSHVRVRYLWSPAESKFLGGLWAHDIAALPLRVEKDIEDVWSQGAYSLEESGT